LLNLFDEDFVSLTSLIKSVGKWQLAVGKPNARVGRRKQAPFGFKQESEV